MIPCAQNCFRMLPYVAGGILVCLVAFAIWVRSVPPTPPKVETPPDATSQAQTLDLDALKNMDPELLAQAGLKLEDLEKMAMPESDVEVDTDGLLAEEGAPPLHESAEDEEISLDDEDPKIEQETSPVRQEEPPVQTDEQKATDEL